MDVGTNSIHTVIAEATAGPDFEVLDSSKEPVRLGRALADQGDLPADAFEDGLAALERARKLCEGYDVERILAVATSAVREAPNGLEFVRQAEQRAGIPLRVISRADEARMIYLAIRQTVHVGDKRLLAVDIGGGSTEFIWGDSAAMEATDSLRLGVLRLANSMPLGNPATAEEIADAKAAVDAALDPVLERHGGREFAAAVVTSGAALQMCRLTHGPDDTDAPQNIHQSAYDAADVRARCEALFHTTHKQRRKIGGLDRTRVDTIVHGAILIDAVLRRFSVGEVIACSYALREGVLYDYLETHRATLRDAEESPDVRRRAVLALGRRCGWSEAHHRHVSTLCLQMFDALAPELGWADEERAFLEYAALLHDIGRIVNVSGHHRHSQYLIDNAGLLGFTGREIQLIGVIVRYHRRNLPKKRHESFGALSASDRSIVSRLAGILRVAEGLDRTQTGVVRALEVSLTKSTLRLATRSDADCMLEIAQARERVSLLEKATGLSVAVTFATAPS